ncbi:MAG: hypothetical protein OXI64_05900 [Defluviicoccus sp.]|nr:hypothetical protein [Defluviicoccus sp.]MDE0334473.1 hypothetical protein [Defluviicoccus sp.]
MRRLAVAAWMVVAVPALPGEAFGHACDRTDNDRREASRVIRNISGRIDAMERSIVETLRLQTGQLSGYHAQSTKAILDGMDAQTKLLAQTTREVEENRIVRDRRPTRRACGTATGARGLGPARRAEATEKVRSADAGVGRIAGDRSVSRGSAADNTQRFELLMRRYCNRGRSGEDATACGATPAMHAADLKAGNLFDRGTLGTAEERRTAIEVSRNLAAPVIWDPFPVASAGTEAEQRLALLARSASARSALAAEYFAHSRSLRAPGAGLGGWVAALVPGRDASVPVSRYEILEVLASKRFEDPNWFVQLQSMTDSNLLREIVTLQAIGLMLDWERWRSAERHGALDAAGLAIAAEEMRRLPGLGNPASGVN